MFIVIFLSALLFSRVSEESWEQAMQRHCNTVSAEVVSLVPEVGFSSIFFTSELQLQKVTSRRRLQAEEQQKEHVFDPNRKPEESPSESLDSDQTSGSEESHPGDLSLGTATDTGFDATSYCDVDPGPNLEPEAGCDSSMPVSGQSLEDNFVVETQVQNSTPSNSREILVQSHTRH